jgi:hypothetical protein
MQKADSFISDGSTINESSRVIRARSRVLTFEHTYIVILHLSLLLSKS